ncbi:hypothetical protein [Sphingobium sp. ZW T5_29]|uniref:hypothetical protein n=1 Tax=Sphingobium sp. ZW T5_29 TaxID=3378077 RepID=UPI003854E431
MIGLLSPVVYSMCDGEEDSCVLVASVLMPAGSTEAHLKLEVEVSVPGTEPISKSATKRIEMPEGNGDEAWKIWLPQAVEIPKCIEGTRIKARLQGAGAEAWASLLYRSKGDQED